MTKTDQVFPNWLQNKTFSDGDLKFNFNNQSIEEQGFPVFLPNDFNLKVDYHSSPDVYDSYYFESKDLSDIGLKGLHAEIIFTKSDSNKISYRENFILDDDDIVVLGAYGTFDSQHFDFF